MNVLVERTGEMIHNDNLNLLDTSCLQNDDVDKETGFFQLRIPMEFWDTFKKQESQTRLLKVWTDQMNDCFKIVNEYCVLAFKNNKCLKSSGKYGKI